MSLMGRSSSMSMGTLVLWIHVLVQRCLSLTYEFLKEIFNKLNEISFSDVSHVSICFPLHSCGQEVELLPSDAWVGCALKYP